MITLQDTINTVTVEGVENVEEEECIEIKTEEDYIQLVRTVKTEQEVSFVLVCFVVVIYLQACVCVHVFCTVLIVFRYELASYIFLVSACQSALCTSVIRSVWPLCVQIIISFSTPLTTGCLHAWGNQY